MGIWAVAFIKQDNNTNRGFEIKKDGKHVDDMSPEVPVDSDHKMLIIF
jgi:hypothetical protein